MNFITKISKFITKNVEFITTKKFHYRKKVRFRDGYYHACLFFWGRNGDRLNISTSALRCFVVSQQALCSSTATIKDLQQDPRFVFLIWVRHRNFLIPICHFAKDPPAVSRFLQYTLINWPNPAWVCSFYLPFSTSRNPTVRRLWIQVTCIFNESTNRRRRHPINL